MIARLNPLNVCLDRLAIFNYLLLCLLGIENLQTCLRSCLFGYGVFLKWWYPKIIQVMSDHFSIETPTMVTWVSPLGFFHVLPEAITSALAVFASEPLRGTTRDPSQPRCFCGRRSTVMRGTTLASVNVNKKPWRITMLLMAKSTISMAFIG